MTDETEKGPFVIVLDTICEGWICQQDENGEPITYETREAAEAELQADFKSRNEIRLSDGEEPDDEPEEFVIPIYEYVPNRKAIWYPS